MLKIFNSFMIRRWKKYRCAVWPAVLRQWRANLAKLNAETPEEITQRKSQRIRSDDVGDLWKPLRICISLSCAYFRSYASHILNADACVQPERTLEKGSAGALAFPSSS